MRFVMAFALGSGLVIWLIGAAAVHAGPSRDDFLNVARQGWVFDFHSSRFRRDASLPPIRFNSRAAVRGSVCVYGAPPHPLSRQTITTFERLVEATFGRAQPVIYAGGDIATCPEAQRIYIRLYSGASPSRLLNDDLAFLDRRFDIGLPQGRLEPILSPAQANGFFARGGEVAHILVKQPDTTQMTPLERDFYASILMEELFQVLTYGVDILKFDRETPFYSKLQEYPSNLRYMEWGSERFMRGLLDSNPKGLCGFDVFMLHALALSQLETSNTDAFLRFIEMCFDQLLDRTRTTLAMAELQPILDADCAGLPD